jgi:hypothetical protein
LRRISLFNIRFRSISGSVQKVFSIQVKQVECDEHTLPFSENQVSEGRPAGFVEACNLAVEHRAFDSKMQSDPGSQFRESPEDVSISGDQFAFAGLDVGKRAEAVHLQFVDELIRVERFRTAGKPHGAYVSRQHQLIVTKSGTAIRAAIRLYMRKLVPQNRPTKIQAQIPPAMLVELHTRL